MANKKVNDDNAVGLKWVISGVNNLRREKIHSAVSAMRRAPYWNPAVALNLNLAWERDYWNHLCARYGDGKSAAALIFIKRTHEKCVLVNPPSASYYKIIFHGCGLVTWHRTAGSKRHDAIKAWHLSFLFFSGWAEQREETSFVLRALYYICMVRAAPINCATFWPC